MGVLHDFCISVYQQPNNQYTSEMKMIETMVQGRIWGGGHWATGPLWSQTFTLDIGQSRKKVSKR